MSLTDIQALTQRVQQFRHSADADAAQLEGLLNELLLLLFPTVRPERKGPLREELTTLLNDNTLNDIVPLPVRAQARLPIVVRYVHRFRRKEIFTSYFLLWWLHEPELARGALLAQFLNGPYSHQAVQRLSVGIEANWIWLCARGLLTGVNDPHRTPNVTAASIEAMGLDGFWRPLSQCWYAQAAYQRGEALRETLNSGTRTTNAKPLKGTEPTAKAVLHGIDHRGGPFNPSEDVVSSTDPNHPLTLLHSASPFYSMVCGAETQTLCFPWFEGVANADGALVLPSSTDRITMLAEPHPNLSYVRAVRVESHYYQQSGKRGSSSAPSTTPSDTFSNKRHKPENPAFDLFPFNTDPQFMVGELLPQHPDDYAAGAHTVTPPQWLAQVRDPSFYG